MSQSECVLVTGGFGCIGVQAVRWLLANSDASVVVGSRRVTKQRIERLFGNTHRSRLHCVELDVTDQLRIENVLTDHAVSRVIHLAALQTPDCNANRDLGLQINLAGTQNVIEAIKKCDKAIKRFVFASSVAVYGPRRDYAGDTVCMLAEPAPVNVYGAWKLAGENISRMFCNETKVPTLSLRPGVLFGPGRDAGLTSTITTAMKNVVRGIAYEIPYRNRQDYLFAADVGAAFGEATMSPFDGYGTFTLPSHTANTDNFVEIMRGQASELKIEKPFQISVGGGDVPFICDLEFSPFVKAFPNTPHTPLAQAIRESLEEFTSQHAKGWLS